MSSAKFDIVVYGATGFTGQLVAEYLAAHYKGDTTLKWAMAGRSLDKLKSVRDAIGAPAETPLIVADASDAASLKVTPLDANGYPAGEAANGGTVQLRTGVCYYLVEKP